MGGIMSGIIERIRVYPEKGAPGTEVSEGRLIENRGLEGDFHATGGERQISLLFTEILDQLKDAKEKGLCFSRFRENITVRGIGAITHNERLAAGDAVLELSGENKHCHEECPLFQAGKRCPLSGASLFAKVLKGGVIRAGDSITRVLP